MAGTDPTTDSGSKRTTMREAIREGIREEMRADETILLYGQDERDGESFDVTTGLYEEFGGRRVRNTPISEAAQVGSAVGAAATGLRPVVELSFANFIGVCFDQIMNQVGNTRYMFGGASEVPLVLRATEGGRYRRCRSAFKHAPHADRPPAGDQDRRAGDARRCEGLIKTSIRSDDPVMFFENKTAYDERGEVPVTDSHTVPFGEANVERTGDDVTVVATQRLFGEEIRVADDLANEVELEVIDPQSLYPLDTETILDSVAKTRRLIVADESPMSYDFHAEVFARVVEEGFSRLNAPPQRVGVPDTPIPFAPGLEEEVLPDGTDIERAVRRVV